MPEPGFIRCPFFYDEQDEDSRCILRFGHEDGEKKGHISDHGGGRWTWFNRDEDPLDDKPIYDYEEPRFYLSLPEITEIRLPFYNGDTRLEWVSRRSGTVTKLLAHDRKTQETIATVPLSANKSVVVGETVLLALDRATIAYIESRRMDKWRAS